MANERKTEDMVENRLRKRGYFGQPGIVVEKQRSDTPRIQARLATASKRGNGVGRPEFIISSDLFPDFIIVIECKALTKYHVSSTLDQYADYAVDGVLLYASFLSKEYDVLAIAVSGQDELELRISHYLQLKGAAKASEYKEARDIVSFEEYYKGYLASGVKFNQDYDALLAYSKKLNNDLQAKKIKEAQRGFLISGILIALKNKAFRDSFRSHKTGAQLAKSLIATIATEFEDAKIPEERRNNLKLSFDFIPATSALISDKNFFISLIEGIESNVNTFHETHKFFDTIGQFYIEFLRYANNDKGLGIVLTPPHIAELFAELAGVNRESTVFDNCCGTAGLLIAAMRVMIRDAKSDTATKEHIKNKQLFGIEYQPDIYALAVSNMILHGDGKTNIHRGDCFSDAASITAKYKPSVGVLNPPYKNKQIKEDKQELAYVLNNADCLKEGGVCVAIVPITCATSPSDLKTTILAKHTLEAVLSMPIDLFHNSKTTVVTCVLVLTANRPHPRGKKTWFGYFREDGFVKTKDRGRIDANGTWEEIKTTWVNAYNNRDIIDGLSVAKEVAAEDEWCAEAYLETHYETIKKADMMHSAKRFFISSVMTKNLALEDPHDEND